MSPILSPDELAAVTGYRQPARQLQELLRMGFWRARRSAAGGVILERAHYDAVCAGAAASSRPPPRLRLPATTTR